MTDYAQMAQDFSRRHRPAALAEIGDPDRFFATAGAQIQAAVTATRDEILGAPRPGETPETFRLRSYQASQTAEELTLADHHLFLPETTGDDPDDDDPVLAADRRMQAIVGDALTADLDS